ncbi:MAG: hypothetical protein A2271_04610 [Candidatus Moranbacteria bacterium RIFOXYA12_FULL_35_19]|nr:MAG: (Dimethylallyl)adenosine tRNA methylthiotransferase MiaB [Candidatus Moranbacteria bacterium GW2011_GWF2_35_39]OGI31912.1 MAG: hypothetical protein A2343_03960 [Candidatus Moranbacteria bacterium RIFOXYB12_FULL_35_8]OGI35720.1 MAG: hypothetical protein A2271_04610 [Candidatus Moranbacteria bacterium RIFOXYA12_FULL_35_19]
MNESDSERIAGFLESQKIKPTKEINKADLVIFNTCGVRQMAEDRVYGQIHNIHVARNMKHETKKPLIILTGCLANRKDVQRRLKDKVDLFCEIKDFPDVIASIAKQSRNIKQNIAKNEIATVATLPRNDNYLTIIPKYTNQHTAYIPIMTGCNNFCSYCVVPYARGREISRPIQDILKEIKNLAKKNCKEIILLGQNVNSYRFIDKNSSADEAGNYNFPKLLNSLAQSFPEIKFKFLTSHPKDFSEKLMKVIAKNKNISREIHLPIQSGSNKILKAMNRPYTQKHYLDLIKKAQKIIPSVSFTTDVIVGFPSETEKDFQESVKVFKKVQFNEAYINKYSPRPGTTAYKLGDPISWDEKKRREKVLRNLL